MPNQVRRSLYSPQTLTVGRPLTIPLQDLFSGQNVVIYQPGALLGYLPLADIYETAINVDFDNDALTIYFTPQTADLSQIPVPFNIDIYYLADPSSIRQIPITAVYPQRRSAGPGGGIEDSRVLPEATKLWGMGDSYELPQLSYFDDSYTDVPEATFQDNASLTHFRIDYTPSSKRNFLVALTDDSGAEYLGVDYPPYTMSIRVAPPLLVNPDISPETIYLAPASNVIIQPRSVLNAIPEQYKENLSLGNFNYEIKQGSELVTIETGTGDEYPKLHIGRAGGRTAMFTGNYTAVIYLRDNATDTPRFALRFYIIVGGISGIPPQNPFPRFIDVPLGDPTGTETPEAPLNPAQRQNTMYQNLPYPPPVRDEQLTQRLFTGTFPDRPSGAVIAALVGKIDQEGTATTIGLADPRRQEKIKPQLLTGAEGAIYDVPRQLPDDFYVNWPHAVDTEEA